MPSEIDQIILYLSRSNTLKRFELVNCSGSRYKLPCSLFSLQELEHLELRTFDFEPSETCNGFSMLRRLKLYDVEITTNSLKRFLTNCPLLEKLYLLEKQKNTAQRDKLTFVELFKSLPSIESLAISNNYMEHFATRDMPPKLPISLVHLKVLYFGLSFMEQDKLLSALCLIKSSPNLTHLSLKNEKLHFQLVGADFLDLQDYSGFKLDHLKLFYMANFSNLAIEMEFLKLIMAKSPMLESVLIGLNENISVDEELKICEELFPRISISMCITISRSHG